MEPNVYARLKGERTDFYMTKKRIAIGRKSKQGDVDVNMGTSRFISRRHLEIALDRNSFYFLCRGKNGIYVDENFHRENKRQPLPSTCTIRFPSTQIVLAFTSLLEKGPLQPMQSPALPLKVDTQFPSPFVSPAPSPTGTISAVNSCPVSPTSAHRHHMPNFDLKAMATYATKLLSNQQQPRSQTESAEVVVDSRYHRDEVVTSPLANASQAPPPIGEVVTEIREDEEEPEDGEEEDEENQGDVPNDVVPSKPEKSSLGIEGIKIPSSERTQQKPPYSYAQLIVQALLASKERRQTLSSIYAYIADMYPYYKLEEKGWKNSIRHNLSLNQYFMKAAREKEGLGFGKGGYWCMHPDYEDKLTSQAFVKRKKKGIPVFPSAHLVSRSAPPSPTHHPPVHNNSNEINNNIKSLDSKFTLPIVPPSSSHFTLPPFFSQLPGGAMNSSHSLPASPSRPPAGFTATPLKFFPIVHGRTTDDLDLLKAQRNIIGTIHEVREEGEDGGEKLAPPAEKRARLDEQLSDGSVPPQQVQPQQQQGQVLTIQAPPQAGGVATIPGAPSAVQFAQPPLQFLPISLMSTMPSHIQQQPPHQSLLAAPLSSFLPQSYFAPRPPPPGAPSAGPPILPPVHGHASGLVSTAGDMRGNGGNMGNYGISKEV